jgi:hypothetical protein
MPCRPISSLTTTFCTPPPRRPQSSETSRPAGSAPGSRLVTHTSGPAPLVATGLVTDLWAGALSGARPAARDAGKSAATRSTPARAQVAERRARELVAAVDVSERGDFGGDLVDPLRPAGQRAQQGEHQVSFVPALAECGTTGAPGRPRPQRHGRDRHPSWTVLRRLALRVSCEVRRARQHCALPFLGDEGRVFGSGRPETGRGTRLGAVENTCGIAAV